MWIMRLKSHEIIVMGISNLNSYIHRESRSFIPHLLHNTLVVIDAPSFLGYLSSKCKLPSQFGGEYCRLYAVLLKYLRMFAACDVDPIFVFGGWHNRDGFNLDTLLNRKKQHYKEWEEMMNNRTSKDSWDKESHVINKLPPLSTSVFLDVVESFQFKHVAWGSEGHLHSAELAVYLNCPVISRNSDLFLVNSDSPMPYCFIPLDSIFWEVKRLNVQCERCETLRKTCSVLSCKRFCLSNSPLKCLNPKLFPLLPLLLGNDYTKIVHVPRIDGVPRPQYPPEWSERLCEIDTRVNWLSQFNNDDLTKPLRAILSEVGKEQLVEMGNRMMKSVFVYIIDSLGLGQEMAQFLNLSPRLYRPRLRQWNMKDIYTDAFKSVLHRFCSCGNEEVSENVEPSGSSVNAGTVVDIMYKWPVSLINKFRRSECATYALDALYVRGGVVLKVVCEDIDLPQSVNKVSEELRAMQYNILLGLEDRLELIEAKCYGLIDHSVTEHTLLNGEFQPMRVSCRPYRLDQTEQSLEEFMSEHFGQTQLTDPFDRQLYWTISFWFRNSQIACNQCEKVSDNPVVLAFSAFAYVSKFTRINNRQISELIDHFQMICESAVSCEEFRISLVHQLTELQLVAYELSLLRELVSGIMQSGKELRQTSEAEKYSVWRMFGSCRLIYWLTICLEQIPSSDRIQYLTTKMIPELIGRRWNRTTQSTVQQAVIAFASLLRAIQTKDEQHSSSSHLLLCS
ncbi:hypothetical protein D915_010345 [Fasciola hepatica]|uniref:XPG N-terminal domain-containing protein n=1 Tax=Fasciola hepatica TaxID=6192 RepID=A0A4E0R043_FASHE|nr:hypothetical protein D915_010345 [Fasciola hepatica]